MFFPAVTPPSIIAPVESWKKIRVSALADNWTAATFPIGARGKRSGVGTTDVEFPGWALALTRTAVETESTY
jgi:hypothetical protein